jgi:hypothetical protein
MSVPVEKISEYSSFRQRIHTIVSEHRKEDFQSNLISTLLQESTALEYWGKNFSQIRAILLSTSPLSDDALVYEIGAILFLSRSQCLAFGRAIPFASKLWEAMNDYHRKRLSAHCVSEATFRICSQLSKIMQSMPSAPNATHEDNPYLARIKSIYDRHGQILFSKQEELSRLKREIRELTEKKIDLSNQLAQAETILADPALNEIVKDMARRTLATCRLGLDEITDDKISSKQAAAASLEKEVAAMEADAAAVAADLNKSAEVAFFAKTAGTTIEQVEKEKAQLLREKEEMARELDKTKAEAAAANALATRLEHRLKAAANKSSRAYLVKLTPDERERAMLGLDRSGTGRSLASMTPHYNEGVDSTSFIHGI